MIGENPRWHPMEQCVYWVEIPEQLDGVGNLLRFDPVTERSICVFEGPAIGGFTIEADGALLLFMVGGAIARWCAGRLTPVLAGVSQLAQSRFNDVIADPLGRIFCGSIRDPGTTDTGYLFCLHRDRTIEVIASGLGTSNGMGFSPDARFFYHTDSTNHIIYRYDFDLRSGKLTNRHVFSVFEEGAGKPDGMLVEENGRVWTALYGGGCLVCLDVGGVEVGRFDVAEKKVTALGVAGEGVAPCVITTAGERGRIQLKKTIKIKPRGMFFSHLML